MNQHQRTCGLRHLGICALLAVLAAVLSAASRASAADRPNIVLIISDDHGYTDYGFMGHQAVTAPPCVHAARPMSEPARAGSVLEPDPVELSFRMTSQARRDEVRDKTSPAAGARALSP